MALDLATMAASGHLHPQMSAEVFTRVSESSVITKVAGRTDMAMSGNEFVIDTGKVRADIVPEGTAKPVDTYGLTFAAATPLKAAVIVDWTYEMRIANPHGVLDRLQTKLVEAINEQIDAAVLYGKSVKSGLQVPNLAYLNQTANRVELGTAAAAAGGLTTDVLAGYNAVVNGGKDFTGFVADPRLRSKLMGAVDLQGRPIYQAQVDLRDPMGSLLGLPVAYSKAVSGQYGVGNEDTKVRAFGGDFQGNLKFGFVDDIKIKMTDTATVGGISMWETNREAALVEAIFGFYIHDLNSFVAYEDKVA